jgi:hypothetical protein
MRAIRSLIPLTLYFLSLIFADPLDGYWQQKVDYNMEITLVDSLHQITGFTTIHYTNNSPDSLDRFYIHLYPNAFQVESVKSREYAGNAGRASRAKYFQDKLEGFISKIDIHDFNVAVQKEKLSWLHKISILKEYNIDDTILKAILKKKIGPGQSFRIDLNWTHHIGEMVERAGYYKEQYNMAQWYPKMAVYDEDGWHADVFHAEGEFYGEFGDFEVTFDLPKAFVIGASGVVTHGDPGWEEVTVDTSIDFGTWVDIYDSNYVKPDSLERRIVTFLAENVHDFAWVASKNFLYEGGAHGDIDVHVLYDKGRGNKWSKDVLKRSIRAIAWLEEKFGKYPYPQVTTVDRVKNGGMEYPMLVMNGRESEGLIVHEYGHIYFYGILANNEVDSPWLDEGFTSTQTSHYLMNRYGDHGFELKLHEDLSQFPKKYWPLDNDLHSDQWRTITFMRSGHDENISRSSYLFNNGSAYGRNAYTKPSLMLTELKYVLGDSLYYAAIQHYYDKWKLKHVNEQRFVSAIEEFTDRELDWFFDPWLHTTHHLDYGISSFKTQKNIDGTWTVNLGIKAIGKRFLPLLVETKFDDGTTNRRWWKNHLWRYDDIFTYSVDKKPISVTIDPDVQTVDLDYRNNSTDMKKTILFAWPGLWHNPRDAYVISWMPNFYYHPNTSGFAPGLTLDFDYGPYEGTSVQANYAYETHDLYWYLGGWRQAVHYFPRTTFHYWAFDRPGVLEFGGEIEKQWNRVYSRTSTHTFSLGFYIQPKSDSTRAKSLGYDSSGKLGVGYLEWSSELGPVDMKVNGASSLGSLSDWNFTRLTATGTYTARKKMFKINERFIIGKIWADKKGIPGQEGYNIEGNSSNDMVRKNYLVDQLYGLEVSEGESLVSHYHLPGDGNLRGFVGEEVRMADALAAFSSEVSIVKSISKLNLGIEFALFVDGGLFWDKLNQDTGEMTSKYISRTLGDAGVGLRSNTNIFEKELYVRFDLPFYILPDKAYNNPHIDWRNWIISLQKSL